jgi:hypothetical protein
MDKLKNKIQKHNMSREPSRIECHTIALQLQALANLIPQMLDILPLHHLVSHKTVIPAISFKHIKLANFAGTHLRIHFSFLQ